MKKYRVPNETTYKKNNQANSNRENNLLPLGSKVQNKTTKEQTASDKVQIAEMQTKILDLLKRDQDSVAKASTIIEQMLNSRHKKSNS